MKLIKAISWFLGIAMFMFGILKVLIPTINGWYSVQMTNSGLAAYIPFWMGIAGEIVVGLAFIIVRVYNRKISQKIVAFILQLASAMVIAMMLVAIYVHLQPNVPAEVLPLKIKPPFIPALLLILGLTNIYLIRRP